MKEAKSSARLVKEETVTRLRERISAAEGLILANFSGLAVQQMEELRRGLRKEGIELTVVKNRLAKRAAEGTEAAKLETFFSGPTAVAFAPSDSVAAAKILADFAKSSAKLEIKGGLLGSQVLASNQVKLLASLPSREVILAQLLAGFKAPLTGLVNVLAGNLRNLVTVLSAIQEQKEA
jgi:large subunit ribosomal protein L10